MSSGAGSARTRSSATPESRRQVKVELGGGVRGVRPQTVLGEVGQACTTADADAVTDAMFLR